MASKHSSALLQLTAPHASCSGSEGNSIVRYQRGRTASWHSSSPRNGCRHPRQCRKAPPAEGCPAAARCVGRTALTRPGRAARACYRLRAAQVALKSLTVERGVLLICCAGRAARCCLPAAALLAGLGRRAELQCRRAGRAAAGSAAARRGGGRRCGGAGADVCGGGCLLGSAPDGDRGRGTARPERRAQPTTRACGASRASWRCATYAACGCLATLCWRSFPTLWPCGVCVPGVPTLSEL